MTARESGTVSGTLPAAVTGQTGRLEKIVYWTAEAWRLIQLLHDDWRWMRKEFEGTVTQGAARYTAGSFSITDFAGWVTDFDAYQPLSIYKTSTGVADEGPIRLIDWEAWRTAFGRGSQTQNRPDRYAISPADELCLGPVPDAAYTVRGEYRATAQNLAANADVPLLPERFHEIIAWRAVMLLDEHDEAIEAIRLGRARNAFGTMLTALRRTQLPTPRLGGRPLA